jgi:hypothetical protein
MQRSKLPTQIPHCPKLNLVLFVQLGTNKRAKAKREELKSVYAAQRAAAAKASSA